MLIIIYNLFSRQKLRLFVSVVLFQVVEIANWFSFLNSSFSDTPCPSALVAIQFCTGDININKNKLAGVSQIFNGELRNAEILQHILLLWSNSKVHLTI